MDMRGLNSLLDGKDHRQKHQDLSICMLCVANSGACSTVVQHNPHH